MKTTIRILCSFLYVASVALLGTRLYAADRMSVTSIKPLLMLAIDQGEAHGQLVGEAATFMRTQFGAASPIEIDVKTLRALTQPDCKRLEVTTRQNGVRETPKHALAHKELVYQVNYCRDGSFPASR